MARSGAGVTIGEQSPVLAGEQVTVRDQPCGFRHRNQSVAPSEVGSRFGGDKGPSCLAP